MRFQADQSKVVKSIDTTILFRYYAFKTIRSPLIIHSIVSKVPDLQSDNKAAQMKQQEINWYSLQQQSDVT